MARVLHIYMQNWGAPSNDSTVQPELYVTVSDDSDPPINDIISPTINLKTLGIYKTPLQMNAAIVEATKTYFQDNYSIPTNGYGATYLCGAYDLLTLL